MKDQYSDFIQRIKSKVSYAIAGAKLDFAVDVQQLMADQHIKRADLATRIEKSRPYVTKILSGEANPTIETMVKVVHSLGGQIHIKVTTANERLSFVNITPAMVQAARRRQDERAGSAFSNASKISTLMKRLSDKKLCANDEGYVTDAEAA